MPSVSKNGSSIVVAENVGPNGVFSLLLTDTSLLEVSVPKEKQSELLASASISIEEVAIFLDFEIRITFRNGVPRCRVLFYEKEDLLLTNTNVLVKAQKKVERLVWRCIRYIADKLCLTNTKTSSLN